MYYFEQKSDSSVLRLILGLKKKVWLLILNNQLFWVLNWIWVQIINSLKFNYEVLTIFKVNSRLLPVLNVILDF